MKRTALFPIAALFLYSCTRDISLGEEDVAFVKSDSGSTLPDGGDAGGDGGTFCFNGICRPCPPSETDCSGLCIRTDIDPSNCGFCGNDCGSGSCQSGTCNLSGCLFTLCSDLCTQVDLDPQHCGDCSTTCGLGQICDNGTCVSVLDGGFLSSFSDSGF